MSKIDADAARQLEREADLSPGARGEILIEAAGAWRRAGDDPRAILLLSALADKGGEDGCYARTELAEIHFDTGDDEKAYAVLTGLAHDPGLGPGPCQLAGELLAEHGDVKGALTWFDRAFARMDEGQLDTIDDRLTVAGSLAVRRRELRRRLGLAPDVIDTAVPERPTAPDQARLDRVHVWAITRDEYRKAQLQWPDEFDETADDYYARLERSWQTLRDEGGRPLRVVPTTVNGLLGYAVQVGGSATEPSVRARYAASATVDVTVDWPPERNAPCWCGSDRKYKKCCGRPGTG